MITKERLQQNVDKAKSETKSALKLIFDSLNQGQQKKIIKNPEVELLLRRYGIIEGE